MRDLIERQAAIDAFGLSERTRKYGGDHSGYDTRMLYEIQDILEGLPPAEPEIIRCRDCKWFGKIGCAVQIVDESDRPSENDFCSFAERRTDETD